MKEPTPTARYTVDRREAEFLVLVDERGASLDVPANALPPGCGRAGSVLDVPVNGGGQPQWKRATRNKAEEERRLREARTQLEQLRGTDPGGDLEI
ncbi:MAG: DUF3006 domain-containing protein [Gemmatimonadaceae bacterium]